MSDSVTYAAAATSLAGSAATAALTTDQVLTIISLCIAAASVAIAGFNAYLNYRDKRDGRESKSTDKESEV
ncbi:MAG: hypothetical protein ACRDDY_13270 [Clostridium sp.]|uniref:hypothetical protein n=1 Tax=Clostridium sp. TaxID=1506 RepID=UPI003EE5B777